MPSSSEPTGPEAIRLARSKWRRDQIVGAALSLLETTGFQQMSVNDLAKQAGISVGTIYQYVHSKEDILLLVIQDILDTYAEAIPAAMEGVEDPMERLSAAFRACCTVVDTHRAGTSLGYRESHILDKQALAQVSDMEEKTTALLVSCLDDAVEAGALIAHDTDLTGWNLVLLAHMWSLKHWHVAKNRSVEYYAQAQLALALRALTTPEARRKYGELLELPEPERTTARGRRRGKAG